MLINKYFSTSNLLLKLIFFVGAGTACYSQVPFQCDGTKYIISQDVNGFYEIDFDLDSDSLSMKHLFNITGYEIHALGYNSKDNLIYGSALKQGKYYLCRLDKLGSLETFTELPFNNQTHQGFYAGDVTPDGQRMVLLSAPKGLANKTLLTIVNLASGNYEVETKELQTLAGAPSALIADVAFSPIDFKLYGYDHQDFWLNQPNPFGGKLVTIDIEAGIINNTFYPQTTTRPSLTSVMFDPFGNLFGISGIFIHDPWWSKVNTVNGFLDFINLMSPIYNWTSDMNDFSDGCSCPYTVVIQHEVMPAEAFACSELNFSFKITNLTRDLQNNVTFTDTLPDGFIFKEVLHNPFGGIVLGLDTKLLTIKEMELPYGTDSLVVSVYASTGVEGTFKNQAFLSNLELSNANINTNYIKSDYPQTITKLDETPFNIIPLDINLPENDFELCRDSTLLLTTIPFQSGINFLWNTGSTSNEILVSQSGTYSVTVSGGCERDTAIFKVIDSPLFVGLGPDMKGQFGDLITVNPIYHFFSPILSYQWEINSPNELLCQDCADNAFILNKNALVNIKVTSESGCVDEATLQVSALKEIYTPNAFSPNFDGINDVFYIQTKHELPIQYFKIFDRWGGVVYETQNIKTNNPTEGWDGFTREKLSESGVYVWLAEINFPDNEKTIYEGEILLTK